MLIKQGKQIRALYELQKTAYEKITWVQGEIKKQNEINKTDLNQKVFSVSKNNFIDYLIISHYLSYLIKYRMGTV